jgi:hypothetical protein
MTATTVPFYSAMRNAALLGNLRNEFFALDLLEDWQVATLRSIAALRGLPQNWNSYGSAPVSDDTVGTALRFIAGSDFPPQLSAPRVMPIGGGGIQLAWDYAGREVEVVIDAESGCELLLAQGDDTVAEVAGVPLHQLPVSAALRWMIGSRTTA